MGRRGLPAIGDTVTIPGEHGDGVTRVGTVEQVGEYSELLSGHLLTLRSVTVGTVWCDTWDPDTMIVVRVGDCGHERTGGYVYTGEPAGSRSMELECVALHDIDAERTWLRGWDEERMEVEVKITGLTAAVVDRATDRPLPAADAVTALRGCMAEYLSPRGGPSMAAGDLLAHLAIAVRGGTRDEAILWLAEEFQEMLAARG